MDGHFKRELELLLEGAATVLEAENFWPSSMARESVAKNLRDMLEKVQHLTARE